MAPRTPILDEYVNKRNVPKTCAKQVYRLTDKELELLKSTTKINRAYRRSGQRMTLYSRASVVTLACKKFGCSRKDLASVLEQPSPQVVNKLVERGRKSAGENETVKATRKPTTSRSSTSFAQVPANPRAIEISDDSNSDSGLQAESNSGMNVDSSSD